MGHDDVNPPPKPPSHVLNPGSSGDSENASEMDELRRQLAELRAQNERNEAEKNQLRSELLSQDSRSHASRQITSSVRKDLGVQSLVKSFSGEEGSQSVREFIQNLKLIAQLGNWEDNDLKFICRMKTTGAAATCLDTHPELLSVVSKFEDYERILKQRFEKSLDPERWLFALSAIKQNQGETARAFADRCREIGLKAMPIPADPQQAIWARTQLNRTLLTAFVRGLQGSAAVTLQVHPPKDLEEAIVVAERVEQVTESRPDSIFAVQGSEQKKVTSKFVDRKGSNERNSGCFECGGKGHFARDCANRREASKKNERSKSTDKKKFENNSREDRRARPKFCFVCGNPNHLSYQCSKRAKESSTATRSSSNSPVRRNNSEN